MAGQALYRKYRSQDFSQVIGQDHVVKTLTAAVASNRLSHAYLFTGPRGVGKTSVARLLARALNCTGPSKPCNACPNCQAAINSSLDVIEIDAASNRSIDAVRDLREKVGLAPTQGAFKIYIIDEVHMLTTEAFNALLKTLEEPPSHAVFILATTEAHKLPETIISRTQRFNFKPISNANITEHLASIAAREQIPVEPAALEVIATAARGGFRDAISMLDQLAASGASPVTAEAVRTILGYSGPTEISALSEAIAACDPAAALHIVSRLQEAGIQPGQLANQLADYWRELLFIGTGAAQTADRQAAALAARLALPRIAQVVEAVLEVSRSHWPQLALEATLVRLTSQNASPAPQSATPALPPPPAETAGDLKRKHVESVAPVRARPGDGQPGALTTQPPSGQPSQPSVQPHQQPGPAQETPPAAPYRETQATPPPAAADTQKAASSTEALPANLWAKVLVQIKAKNNSLGALLQMYPVDFAATEVTIKPRFNFHRDLFVKPANRTIIESAAAKVYGRHVKVSARTDDTAAKTKRAPADSTAELVSSALEILGGEVVE